MPIVESTVTIDGEEVTIYVEVEEPPTADSPYRDLRGDSNRILEAARDVFGEGLELSRNCAKRVVDGIRKMDESVRPTEFEVQLAIKLDSEVGAILAKATTGAQMQVTMTWKKDDGKEEKPSAQK